MSEIKFQIIKHIMVLSTNEKNGWNKELSLISWNDQSPKFDIRSWSPDHQKMCKGITLTKDELLTLLKLDANQLVD